MKCLFSANACCALPKHCIDDGSLITSFSHHLKPLSASLSPSFCLFLSSLSLWATPPHYRLKPDYSQNNSVWETWTSGFLSPSVLTACNATVKHPQNIGGTEFTILQYLDILLPSSCFFIFSITFICKSDSIFIIYVVVCIVELKSRLMPVNLVILGA